MNERTPHDKKVTRPGPHTGDLHFAFRNGSPLPADRVGISASQLAHILDRVGWRPPLSLSIVVRGIEPPPGQASGADFRFYPGTSAVPEALSDEVDALKPSVGSVSKKMPGAGVDVESAMG